MNNTQTAQNNIQTLNLNLGELAASSSNASTGVSSLKIPLQGLSDQFGLTTKQFNNRIIELQKQGGILKTLGLDKAVDKIKETAKNIVQPKENEGFWSNLWNKATGWFSKAVEDVKFTDILLGLAEAIVNPVGFVADKLKKGVEKIPKTIVKNTETDDLFSPPPSPGTTEAQAAPLKSATSGTLAADLPEGSWTAFLDKTAKVFDEALKAVIKGFDVALAKLVAGEGRRLAQVFAT